MGGDITKHISRFFVAGINYKKTDASVRGQFAINNEQYLSILSKAHQYNINELFILSTCNRTEIYGFAENIDILIDLLCSETAGAAKTFKELAYIKNGQNAVEHLFTVAAGIDSQILGDYEIVGQLKTAAKFAKQHGFIGAFTERLVNAVLQSSKNIKTVTQLSGGTVSVSFAAVQYIKEHITDIPQKKMLLLGTGKIGRNTCKNIVDYLQTSNITLMNRTEEKASELSAELGLKCAPIEELDKQLEESDIILVATNAAKPVIKVSHLLNKGSKLIIDLSIPNNVEASAAELPGIRLINVDELSKMKDETLQKREAEVPKAKAIIQQHIIDFTEWHDMRKNVPVLKAVKQKLQSMQGCTLYTNATTTSSTPYAADKTDEKIQKVINVMANKMRNQNQRGCNFIEAINDYIEFGNN